MDFTSRTKKADKAKETRKLYGGFTTKHIRIVEKLKETMSCQSKSRTTSPNSRCAFI